MHDRATIPEMTARHVVVNLLASGQVARMNAGWLVTRSPGSRPTLQRFWGTVCQDGEAAHLLLFLNDRCLLLPLSLWLPARQGVILTSSACRSQPATGPANPGKTDVEEAPSVVVNVASSPRLRRLRPTPYPT